MNFSTIDQLKGKLSGLRPLNDTELKRLREEFMIENTYNSNAIEGNTLTLRETALILQEGVTIAQKPVKEHLEAIGHKDAFEYIVTLADAHSPLTAVSYTHLFKPMSRPTAAPVESNCSISTSVQHRATKYFPLGFWLIVADRIRPLTFWETRHFTRPSFGSCTALSNTLIFVPTHLLL